MADDTATAADDTSQQPSIPAWLTQSAAQPAQAPADAQTGIDRRRFAAELNATPGLQDHIMAVSAGENLDPQANLSVLESMMNRATMMGTSLAQESKLANNGGYYAGYNPRALDNPNTRAMVEGNLKAALNGSNVSNYATDNASGDFAAGRAKSGMYTPVASYGGETFSYPSRSDARGFGQYQAFRQNAGTGTPYDPPEQQHSSLAQAIAPVRRAIGMADYPSNGPVDNSGNQYGNGYGYYNQNDPRLKMGQSLIANAMEPVAAPRAGTAIGKLAMLLAGQSYNDDARAQQKAYMASDPALGGSGQPQVQQPQSSVLTRLIQHLAGTEPKPQQPQPAPARPYVPVTMPGAPQQPGQTPNSFAGATVPQGASAAPAGAVPPPNAAPLQAQPEPASAQRQMLIPPSADANQARAKIEEQFPEKQIWWNLHNGDSAIRTLGQTMAQAKRTALAAIDQPDTEPKQVTLPDGTTAYGVGNRFTGYMDSGQPHIDPAQIAGLKKAAEAEAEVGPAGEKAYATETGTYYGHKFSVIQANAQTSATELPQLRLLQSVMNNPAYISGAGATTLERLSSAARTMGWGDGQIATLQQVARKLGQAGALENVEELGQQGAVRNPVVNIISHANYSDDNTPEANRAVVEIRARQAERNLELASMATDYAAQHNRINAQFDKAVLDNYKAHPLLSDDEVKNYEPLLNGKPAANASASGAPAAPAAPAYTGPYITNKATGQRMMVQGGKWVPAQ